MKWLIFKRKAHNGRTAGWYALHESDGTGGFFVGPDAWQKAIDFVSGVTPDRAEAEAQR